MARVSRCKVCSERSEGYGPHMDIRTVDFSDVSGGLRGGSSGSEAAKEALPGIRPGPDHALRGHSAFGTKM